MKTIIIIPAYNEEENILKTCNGIINYNKEHNTNYDFIVINDCSKDKTLEICKKNNLPVIDLVHNLGIGGAVQTGYKYAYENNYDIAVQFDGDGQHNIKCVENIIKPIINKSANMVIGSRFIDENSSEFKSSAARRVGIKMISSCIKIFTGKKIYDPTSGFRAVDKNLIKQFSNGYPTEYPEPISEVMVLNDKLVIEEVPVSMNERKGGISSIRAWKNLYYMVNVILSIFVVSLRRNK